MWPIPGAPATPAGELDTIGSGHALTHSRRHALGAMPLRYGLAGWGLVMDRLRAGAGRLWPGTVFSLLEVVVGHLAFHRAGLAAEASDGQEPFQEVLLEHHQCSDQEVGGENCPA